MSNWLRVPDIGGVIGYDVPGIVIWVDPSDMLGWFKWLPGINRVEGGECRFLEFGYRLERYAGMESTLWLGWESFTIRPGTSRTTTDTSAPEAIGMLKWIAHRHGFRVLPPQQPDARVLGQKHLKAAGWQQPGLDDATSAAAHCLSWALSNHVAPSGLVSAILSQEGDTL